MRASQRGEIAWADRGPRAAPCTGVKIFITLVLLLAGCHSSRHVECGVALPESSAGITGGAPESVFLDATVLDRGTNTIIELPSFTLDGTALTAVCTDHDAGRCPGWQVLFENEITSGKHTLGIGAINYATADVEVEAKTQHDSSPCGSGDELESITPASVTVTLGP